MEMLMVLAFRKTSLFQSLKTRAAMIIHPECVAVAAKDEFDQLGSLICLEKKRETIKHL